MDLNGRKISIPLDDGRLDPQKVCMSNTRQAAEELGGPPGIGVKDGVARLSDWVAANPELFID